MKLNCGPSSIEWTRLEYERKSNWHDHFALIPRRVGQGDCRWLEWIERKGEYYGSFCDAGWVYEYRAKE